MSEAQTKCPNCGNLVLPGSNFCQTCGLQLVNNPKEITIGRQIYIYVVSIFLPPLGLVWFFKYLMSSNSQLKRIGIIAGVITIVSSIITIWWAIGFIQGIQSQISTYSNLGM